MKTAKIFQNGQSQAVRLPKDYRLKGKQVFVKRVGDTVLLIPEKNSWDCLINSLDSFSADFMLSRNQPGEQQKRESLFK